MKLSDVPTGVVVRMQGVVEHRQDGDVTVSFATGSVALDGEEQADVLVEQWVAEYDSNASPVTV